MSAFLRKYGVATTINFPLISLGTVNFTSTATLTTADMKISVDGGAYTTSSVAIVNVGSFGYSYTCRAGTEMTGKMSTFVIISTAGTKVCEDTMFFIETYGNSAAQHTFDLSVANQVVIASAGTVTLTAAQVVTVGTNNDKTGYSLSQTFPTNFADLSISATTGAVKLQPSQTVIASAGTVTVSSGTITSVTNSVNIVAGALVNASTVGDKTGYSLTQTFPTNFADLSISATTGAVKLQPSQTVIASAGTVVASSISGITFPTNFSDLSITATTGGVKLQAAQVVTIGTNNDKTGYALTQTFPNNFADLSITATTGLVTISTAATVNVGTIASTAVSSIWNIAAVPAMAVPTWTASMLSTISWLFGLSKNVVTQNSVLQTVIQSDGSTTLATATIGDNGTLFTRGSFN